MLALAELALAVETGGDVEQAVQAAFMAVAEPHEIVELSGLPMRRVLGIREPDEPAGSACLGCAPWYGWTRCLWTVGRCGGTLSSREAIAMGRKPETFFEWDGPRQHYQHGGREGWLPLFYQHNETFASLHRASFDAVEAALPSEDLVPYRWVDGSALVMVQAFRYHEVTWTGPDGSQGQVVPYGEISVAAAATLGPAPPVLPLLQPRLSGFVLQLPVTTREARDGGREVYGFPKFLADMDFAEAPDSRQVRLSEGGRDILALTVSTGGPVVPDRRPMLAYTAKDGRLWETVVPVLGHVQPRVGGRSGHLELGDHDVARALASLEVSASPLAVFNYLDHRSILPGPSRSVGSAKPYPVFPGREDEFARYTVRYPGTPALNQYGAMQPVPA